MIQFWIWSASSENWDILDEKRIWATYSKTATEKVKPGDYVIFYVVGTGTFKGSYKVKSKWYESKDIVWADEKTEQTKMYPYQCDLEPHVQGYAVYSELAPQLSFIGNKSNPQAYIMGAQGGPGNFQRPIPESDFLHIIKALQEGPPSPPPEPEEKEMPEHDSIVARLLDIGTSLGFVASDSREDTNIAKGAVVDAIWVTRIANLGEIRYVFEVQIEGSIDSLLMNLLRASANPTVRRLVVVSKTEKIDKIKGEAENLPQDFKNRLLLWSIEDTGSLYDLVNQLNEQKRSLGIGL